MKHYNIVEFLRNRFSLFSNVYGLDDFYNSLNKFTIFFGEEIDVFYELEFIKDENNKKNTSG